MISPDSIANKRFDKGMGGFRQDEVEEFLKQVAEEFRLLLAEKAELEQKIEVLASKIEQYREDEDSLRSALIGAQKLGDSVIRESKAKAEMILREANAQASRAVEDVQKDVQNEQQALVQMKKEVTKFKNRLLSMYRQHLDIITSLPDYSADVMAVETAPAAEPEPIAEEVPAAPAPAAPESKEVPEEKEPELEFSNVNSAPESNTSMSFSEMPSPTAEVNSKFGQLKFGEGFDMERDEVKKSSVFSRKKHH